MRSIRRASAETSVSDSWREIGYTLTRCNWLQAAENILDPVHVEAYGAKTIESDPLQGSDGAILLCREIIDRDYQVEGDLRREIAMNIKRALVLESAGR